MPYQFFITYTGENFILPSREFLSAVFLIAIKGTKILCIRNERGLDIPGGHIEPGETPQQALIREVYEEAGATFEGEKLFAIVESDAQDHYKDEVMLMYATKDFKLGEFIPSEDAFGREVLEIDEFSKRYTGNFDFSELIRRARKLQLNHYALKRIVVQFTSFFSGNVVCYDACLGTKQ